MKDKQVKNIIIRDGYLYGVDDDFMDLAIDGLIEEFVTIYQWLKEVKPMNRIITKKGNLYGVMNESGQIILEPSYDYISEFNPWGYAVVKKSSDYRLIDIDGKYTNNDRYVSLRYIEDEEKFIGERIGKLCFINFEREIIMDPAKDYDMIYYLSNGFYQVEKDEKYGYIDEEGNEVIPLQYIYADAFSENGLALVELDNNLIGYINTKGEMVIEGKYDTGTYFSHNLAAVSIDGKYIYIDSKGNQAIDQTYKYAGEFTEFGLAKTQLLDGREQLIRPDGSPVLILDEEFEIEEFVLDKKITTYKGEGKVGLINSQGEIITGLKFDQGKILENSEFHPFLKDGYWGYLNDEGKVVLNRYATGANSMGDLSLLNVYYPIREEIEDIEYNRNREKTRIKSKNKKNEDSQQTLQKEAKKYQSGEFYVIHRFFQGTAPARKKEYVELDCHGRELGGRYYEQTIY